jgi:hypothetical protein
MHEPKDLRTLGKIMTIGAWGIAAILFLTGLVKSYVLGQPLDPRILSALGVAVLTILGVLTSRLVTGIVWVILGVIGVLFVFIGFGFDIVWMQYSAIGLLTSSTITLRLLFIDWPYHAVAK